jgi:hypothetical protein
MRRFRSHFSVRRVAGFIVLAIAGVFLFGNIVMLLWNALLPVLFHFPIISFWQALGLLLLAKILFGNFRGGGRGGHWKNRMEQKWMSMTPEEKERFKQDWGNRCGRDFQHGPASTATAKQEG